ncbi:MAG: class I SAM-dependent methyltransferase [Thermoguttaceae bacterium]|nr:class I SAM-dependent methyltransferase [Thermoguttaceae bacterium]
MPAESPRIPSFRPRAVASVFQAIWSFVRHPRRSLRHWRLRRMTPEQVFNDIYRRNAWSSAESVSGLGSGLDQTIVIRRELPALVREFGWRSMLDLPCGDFHWMSHVELDLDYLGADIVDDLIQRNQARYAGPGRRFVRLDLLADPLPAVDVVLCRDCLVHFSHADVRRALANLCASGSRFLLTTTHVHAHGNRDIPTGAFWPLDLQAAPFLLPRPIRLIDERCTHRGSLGAKCLALWHMEDVVPRPATSAAA